MSIELRQAAQRALNALDEATTYTCSPSWSPSMTDECIAAASALRAALSQQPATPKPVWFTYQSEIEYADSTGGNGSFWRVPPDLDDEAVPLYDRPAPSVPGVDFELQELREIERAMDDFADCGETDVVDTLLLRAVQAGFLECTHFHVANRGALQEAIDAAMLADKAGGA